jgi:hypothetical protein
MNVNYRESVRLEYRTNNAYSAILLVDTASGFVRSKWDTTGMPDDKVLINFFDRHQDAADWDDHHLLDDEIPADTCGNLIAWRD